MNIDRAQNAYRNDLVFRQLVDHLHSAMSEMQYTPGELRDAAMLAAIHFEQSNPRQYMITPGILEDTGWDAE